MSNGAGAIPGVVLGTLAQLNPILGTVVTLIGTYKALRNAVKAANPTVVFDKSTGNVYEDEKAAATAGVTPENIVSELPSDAVLIEQLIVQAGLLKADARAAREWLRTIDPSLPPLT